MTEANNNNPKRPKHNMTDWLTLHALSAVSCERILRASYKYTQATPPDPEEIRSARQTMSADEAWQLAAEALSAFFTTSQSIVEISRRNTRTDFRPDPRKHPRAFTLNDGGNGFPFVSCNYRGLVSDISMIAHEFAHAVQIVASNGRFVAPVIRETCAFTGELALLSLLQDKHPDLYKDVRMIWLAGNDRFFRKHRKTLQSALHKPKAPYSYQWNYPLARILSIESQRQLTGTDIWTLFEGRTSLKTLCDRLEF